MFINYIELWLFRGSEGVLYHGHMGEIFGVGEGDGTSRADAAASLALDADAVESGEFTIFTYAPHRAHLHALIAACTAVGVAGGFRLEEAGGGVIGL